MDDRGKIAMSIGLGALLGGVAGYLFLTERGRDLRVNLEPRMNDLLREVEGLSATFERTRAAVAEGLASFNRFVEDPSGAGTGAETSRAHGAGPQASSGQRASGPTLWTKETREKTRETGPGSTH